MFIISLLVFVVACSFLLNSCGVKRGGGSFSPRLAPVGLVGVINIARLRREEIAFAMPLKKLRRSLTLITPCKRSVARGKKPYCTLKELRRNSTVHPKPFSVHINTVFSGKPFDLILETLFFMISLLVFVVVGSFY